MHYLSTIFLLAVTAADIAYAATLPSYTARHHARSIKMPGIKLVAGDVKMGSYIVRRLSFFLPSCHLADTHIRSK